MSEILYIVIAQAGGGGAGGSWWNLLLMVGIIFGIMYFLVIRPQNKQRAEREKFLSALKVGDKVVTGGGILGKLTGVQADTVTVEISDRVRVKVMRSQVNPVAAAKEEAAADDKSEEKKKK